MSTTVNANEVVDWYDALDAPIGIPELTNVESVTAYAQARNTITGCVSALKTEVTLEITKRPITITVNPGQTKIYGDADPLQFQYTVTGDGLGLGDAFAGTLVRETGENVGDYVINKGTLLIVDGTSADKEANYDITFVVANFKITPLNVIVTPDANQSKIYNDVNPVYTYGFTPALVGGDAFSGALSRDAGEDVGLYNITQGDLALSSNYTLTFTTGVKFEIKPKEIIVTPTSGLSKIYGDGNPVYTYGFTPALDGGDAFTGALSRDAGEDVGLYNITQGTLALSSNYTLTFVTGVQFEIKTKEITVTPTSGQSKIYGDVNPVYTYGFTPALVGGDAFSGALSRDAGEDVGLYDITQGTLALSSNYTLTFTSGVQFEIKTKEIIVTPASGQSKIYGDVNPVYTYGFTPALAGGDAFSGALSRDAGEDAGLYNITQGTLALSSNYTLTFVTGVQFEIKKKEIIVTPDANQSKIYNDVNPVYTYGFTPALAGGDAFSGALSRDAGEDVGLYNITQGDLALNSNYTLTFTTGVKFEIKPKEIIVTPTSGLSKIYGDGNPVYTYGFTPALVGGDAFTGALSRDAGEDVGLYNITQGTLALSSNYTLTFVTGVQFEIKTKEITVTPTSGQSKIYGDVNPVYTYGFTPALVGGDAFSGALGRDAGEDVGLYDITQGTLALSSNYTLTFTSGVQFEIKTKEIIVTPASGQSKIYGDVNPVYTYGFTPALAGGDAFSGALSRDAGEDAGLYNITQGTLALSSNYTLTFVTGVQFEIKKKEIIVRPDANQSKIYNDVNPVYTYGFTPALVGGDAFSGALSRDAGEDVGLYNITQGDLALSSNYTLTFTTGVKFEIKPKEIIVTPTSGLSKIYGDGNPVYTYGFTPALVGGDAFTGALSRDAGEDVGLYNITQGTLALSSNYTLTFVTGVQFEIKTKEIIVTPTSGQSKIFGDVNPVYTYGFTPSLVGGDAFSGALGRDAGEDVGLYNITQGTLALSSNYTLTFTSGVQFEIKTKEIIVTPASGQSKIYGDVNPVYTYGFTPALAGGDTFSGALSRDAGEDAGLYNITQGTLVLSSNYTLTFVTGVQFEIKKKEIIVTPDANQSKIYNDVNPVYTYGFTPALVGGDAFSGALSRDAGEDVGLYNITQGDLALSSNYTLTFTSGVKFEIKPKEIIVTPTSGLSKIYGDGNPVYTYGFTPALVGGDAFIGALSRDAGEDVGLYNITQGTLALSSNYTLTFVTGVQFEIKTKEITVTPTSGQSKIFGDVNPVYTYGFTPALVGGDAFSGALGRDAGEDVGLYNITQGTLALSSNYTLTFTSGVQFEIKTKEIIVTPASGQSKIYGDVNPVYTYGFTPALAGGDAFSGALSRDAGEDAGLYNITQGTLVLSSNYTLTFVTGVQFEIKKKEIIVTPDANQSKIYNDVNPVYTYGFTPALVGGDAFTGALSRDAGEDVGLYNITQGDLALSSNYTLTFTTGVKFEIKPKEIIVTPTSGLSKIYGDGNPVYTYGFTPALVGGDAFTGALSRDAGEDVGLYNITQGTLALSSNYTLTFVTGVQFEIKTKEITVTPTSGQSKIFGDVNPVYTYGFTPALVGGDAFSGALGRDAGEDVGLYDITQGTLALSSNYTLSFTSGVQFEIKTKEIIVTPASGQSKIYGDVNPVYTYGFTPALAGGDAFSGALSRDAGEDAGLYNITQGTLALSSNYTLTFTTGVKFEIKPKEITVTPTSGLSKIYGDGNPVYTYGFTPALVGGDTFTGALSRDPGEDVGLYNITQGTLALSSNYTLIFTPGVQFEITPKAASVTPNASGKVYGDTDPAFTGTLVGFLAGDNVTATYSRTAGETVTGSPYIISAVLSPASVLSNYTIVYNTANFNITPKALVITASDRTKSYGEVVTFAGTEFTTPAGALVNGDAVATVTLTSAGASGTATVAGSPYPIIPSAALGTGLGNYSISYVNGTMTVNPNHLTITASNRTKTYGDAVIFAGTEFTTAGLVNGDAVTSVTLTSAGAAATATVAGSPYPIVPSQALGSGLGNYTIGYVNGTLNVVPAALTITANNGNKVYGSLMTYTGTEFTSAGLVNGNTITGVSLTSTGDPATATIGTYPIVASGATGTGLSNYTINYVNGTLTVTPKALTITASDLTKTYGDVVTFAGTEFTTPAGALVNGDAVTSTTITSAGAPAAAVVGAYPIVISAAVGSGLSNYTINYVSGTLTVGPHTLTITATDQTKIYGQVFTFAGTEFTSEGLVNGNTITSVTLASAGAAAAATNGAYPIVPSAAIGTGLGNYTIAYVNGSLTVNPKAIAITASNRTKIYGDVVTFAGTEFTIPAGALINGDAVTSVTLTSTGSAATATVAGSPYPIVASAAVGTGLSNYTISYVNGSLTVTQKVLTVGGTFTVNNKVYDGTNSATFAVNNLTLLTLVGSDNVTLNATPVFADKVVGTGKPVSLTGLSIAGPDAGNYTLSFVGAPTATADITARVLTIGGTFTADDKVYDGTTAATISNNSLTLLTLVGGDVVNLNAVAAFSDKAIGSNKIVSLTGSTLTGADAINYSLSFAGAAITTANITGKALTIGGSFTAGNKVYDATTDAAISTNSLTLLGKSGTDNVNLTAVASFADKLVGTGKIVNLTGSSLNGADAGNYTLSFIGAPTAIADITTRVVTIGGTFTANNKVYDGTTAAMIALNNLTLLTIAGSDNVTLTAVASFSDPSVGLDKIVSLTGSSLSGSDASNYTLSLVGAPTTTARISEFGLIITGVTADNKVYDGTIAAVVNTANATLSGVLGNEVVNLVSTGVTGTFTDKNVGSGKAVITTGFVITGADADKYSLLQPTVTADITPIGLTITGVVAENKVYDGTTTASLNTGSAILEGVLAGDDVNLVTSGALGSFADKNIGLAKPVTTSFSLEGSDAGNYTLTQPSLTADITIANLTISGVTANSKTYDGNTSATLNTGSANLSGLFGTDVVNLITSGATGTFSDKNAGIGKPVATSGFATDGADAGNYTFIQPSLIADILPKASTITANDLSKTYGEALIFAGTEFTMTGLVQGDPVPGVSLSSTGAPALADVGEYGILVFGGSDANYDFTYVEGILTVNKADQVITFATIPSGLRMTQEYPMDATASSGLPVSFEISDPHIASINGNILKINQDGNFTITVTQAGDKNWNPADAVLQSVNSLPTFDNITSLFTPNNDGINDYWYIPDLEQYGKLQVTVYNRYGQAVYRSDSYKNDWDGTWNGYPLPSATYYYIIKSSEKGIIKGVVNIVR